MCLEEVGRDAIFFIKPGAKLLFLFFSQNVEIFLVGYR